MALNSPRTTPGHARCPGSPARLITPSQLSGGSCGRHHGSWMASLPRQHQCAIRATAPDAACSLAHRHHKPRPISKLTPAVDHTHDAFGSQHPHRRQAPRALRQYSSRCCGSVARAEEAEEGDEAEQDNALQGALRWAFTKTGLQGVAEALDDNWAVSVAIVVLYLASLAASFASGDYAERISNLAVGGVYLLAGVPETVELCLNVAGGLVDTHVLMTLAALGLLALGQASEGALLLVLFNVSHAVEHLLTDKAQGNLASLLEKAPQTATILQATAEGQPDFSQTDTVRAVDVHVGSLMLVRPGEQVALDGQIVSGEANVSTESITGEAVPVRKVLGDELPSGARVEDGALVVKATRPASESTIARIAQLSKQAKANRPKLQTRLQSFTDWYSKVVIVLTVGAVMALRLSGVPLLGAAGQAGALYRAMGMLTAAAPCALVIAPLSYVAAMAALYQDGILVTGTVVLEALAQCGTAAFDKTGTLTTGQLAATSMRRPDTAAAANGAAPQHSHNGHWAQEVHDSGSKEDVEALELAIALSQRSNHPVSRALTSLDGLLHQNGADLSERISNFRAVPGKGVECLVSDSGQSSSVRFGSLDYIQETLPSSQASRLKSMVGGLRDSSVVSVLVKSPTDEQHSSSPDRSILLRAFTFEDQVRSSSAAALEALQQGSWRTSGPSRWLGWLPILGRLFKDGPRLADALNVMMLTGDNVASARSIAAVLGVKEVQAGLSPEQKLAAIQTAQQQGSGNAGSSRGSGVIMVGDGVNDAPALAAANVGVAVAASPSEAAAAVADVILLSDNGAEALPFLLQVAHDTKSIVRQNLTLAFGSIICLALPAVFGWIPLWKAVALHEGCTLLVALNSLKVLVFSRQKWTSHRPQAGEVNPIKSVDKQQASKAERHALDGEEEMVAAVTINAAAA